MSKPIKRLICTVGLPRSGKSRFVKYMSFLDRISVVCPDDIRFAMHGHRFIKEAEPLVWAIAETMVRYFFHRGHQDVFLDSCNQTTERRKRWIKPEWETYFCHIDTTADTCLGRAITSNDLYIDTIIKKMSDEFESLDKDCEPDDVASILLGNGYEAPFTVWRPKQRGKALGAKAWSEEVTNE